MLTRVYVDMDNVLAQWAETAARIPGLEEICTRVIEPTQEQWDQCTEKWWADLPWCEDGRAILGAAVAEVGEENVYIATAHSARSAGCLAGKRAWIVRELGVPWMRRTIFIKEKFLLANRSVVLIDDLEKNTEPFRAAGGRAILVPRPWNHYGGWEEGADVRELVRTVLQSYRRT